MTGAALAFAEENRPAQLGGSGFLDGFTEQIDLGAAGRTTPPGIHDQADFGGPIEEVRTLWRRSHGRRRNTPLRRIR